MYDNRDKLVIFDADGTLINTFPTIQLSYARHQMDLGDLERFQRRRSLFKYMGGLREFAKNLRQQLKKESCRRFRHTLTDLYRSEVSLFPAAAALLKKLLETPGVRVGIVSHNITFNPVESLRIVLRRHGIDPDKLDFLHCIPYKKGKVEQFRAIHSDLGINPARVYACGDEYRDYSAAIKTGFHPVMVSYGFEDYHRLTKIFSIPAELITRAPEEMANRLYRALDIDHSPNPNAS